MKRSQKGSQEGWPIPAVEVEATAGFARRGRSARARARQAEVLPGSLYDYPAYYDLVFNDEMEREVDFLLDCFDVYSLRPVERIYEPAAGTGRLLAEMARRGKSVVGCDLSESAVAHLNTRLERLGHPAAARVADMRHFMPRPKVHAAFNLISSFQHLLEEEGAEQHLRRVARSLVKGGVYVLASDLCPRGQRRRTRGAWTRSVPGLSVATTLRTLTVDWRRRREVCEMTSVIREGDSVKVIREHLSFRTYTLRQLRRLFARVDGLRLVATYDFSYSVYDPSKIDDSSRGGVFVLRKQEEPSA